MLEQVFQLLEMLADCRLAQVQFGGSSAQVTIASNGHEAAQELRVHGAFPVIGHAPTLIQRSINLCDIPSNNPNGMLCARSCAQIQPQFASHPPSAPR